MTPGASGAPRTFAPRLDRLEPGDLYRYMDYTRGRWDELNVYVNAKRVGRLRRLVDRMPDPYCERCQPHLTWLARHIDYPEARNAAEFLAIGQIVSEWGRRRRTA